MYKILIHQLNTSILNTLKTKIKNFYYEIFKKSEIANLLV